MPPRPALKSRDRPTSAIYLGSGIKQAVNGGGSASQLSQTSSPSPRLANGLPTHLPDLPEPDSPISSRSSSDSGLPSPPATNSTGSGSTGDPGSVARRQRPLSLASDSSASTGSSTNKAMSDVFRRGTIANGSTSRSSSRLADHDDYDDDDDDNDRDGDDTARLDRRFHIKSSSENVLAKQRAMSLTQRNRMALDKLTRLSPSPSPSPRSKSPVPSHASSTSSSRLRQVRTVSQPAPREHGHSGSETEREDSSQSQTPSSHSQSPSSYASSSNRPVTPASTTSHPQTTSPYNRLRHISPPESPHHNRLLNAISGGSNSSDSPTSRRQKRSSMATMAPITQYNDDDDEPTNDDRYTSPNNTGRDRLRAERDTVRDITQSALAAVASSRQSPVSTRRRGALPREFREESNGSSNADSASVVSDARTRRSEDVGSRPSRLSLEPITPHRGSAVGRSATLRETRYGGVASRSGNVDRRTDSPDLAARRERRQSLRGGSAESALAMRSPGGRTLVGEGLRAAGLTPKKGEFRIAGDSPRKGTSADIFHERRSEWSAENSDDRVKRRATTYSRASTSMGSYRHSENRAEEREDRVRTHRSTHSVTPGEVRELASLTRRARDGSLRDVSLVQTERDHLRLNTASPLIRDNAPRTTPLARATPQHLQERYTTSSPLGIKRASAATPGPGLGDPGRLMLESLAAFESVVNRLPPVGGTSVGMVPTTTELLKHAQILVSAAERMNILMRQGSGRALEEQVNADLDGENPELGQHMLDVWRQVGGEYREGLRASDELVRSITSFLMDTGTIFRKLAFATTSATSDYGSPATHARAVSLDEEGLRQQQRMKEGSEPSGRRSSASRRSWQPSLPDRDREREDTLLKLGGGRDSSAATGRPASTLRVRERERGLQTPSPSSGTRPLSPLGGASSRRSFASRDQLRHDAMDSSDGSRDSRQIQPSDSQRTVQGAPNEPSPSPVPRTLNRDRSRTLPPAPPPLAALPSEQARRTPASRTPMATVERVSSVRNRHERSKPSVASVTTVRGTGPPSISNLTAPGSATTLVSHHTVSSSPEVSTSDGMMLPRSNSDRSVRSSVVFSHPDSASVSAALSDLQHRRAKGDERRMFNDRDTQPSPAAYRTPAKPSAPGLSKARSEDPKRLGRAVSLSITRPTRSSLDDFGAAGDRSHSPSVARRSNAHPADRSAVSTLLTGTGLRANRRTVTDIWPGEGH